MKNRVLVFIAGLVLLLSRFHSLAGQSCETPANFSAREYTRSSVLLKWQAVAGATRYQVGYKEASQTTWTNRLVSNADSFIVTGLSAGKTYEFRVFTQCGTARSSFSDTLSLIKQVISGPYCEFARWRWQHGFGGSGNDWARAISVDFSGNSLVVGEFEGTINIRGQQFTAQGGKDIILTKWNADGELLWVRTAGGKLDDAAFSVDFDAEANAYITGYFKGLATFGDQLIGSSNSADVFTAKYDPNGNFIWIKNEGSAQDDYAYAIATDGDGNSYVVGSFRQQIPLGNQVFRSVGESDAFIVKYDKDKNVIWARQIGGTRADLAKGVSVDALGNCYVIGQYEGSITIGTQSYNAIGSSDLFVIKYSSNGNLLWSRSMGGAGIDLAHGVASTDQGLTAIVGSFMGSNARFGGVSLNSEGSSDGFLALIQTNGTVTWARRFGGTEADFTSGSVAFDALDNPYIAGNFRSSASIGFERMESAGGSDAFAAQFDKDGTLLWVKTAGGKEDDLASGISVDLLGNAFVAGNFQGFASFDNNVVRVSSGFDAFIANVTCKGETCYAPFPVAINNITRNSAVITWNAVPGIAEYRVEFREAGNPTLRAIPTRRTTVTLNGLIGNTNYEVVVRSICNNNKPTQNDNILGFKTKSSTDCVSPNRVFVVDTGLTSLDLEWEAVAGATRYLVEYRKPSDPIWYFIYSDARRARISFLDENTTYRIRVSSICRPETGDPTPEATATTRRSPKCEPPVNVMISDIEQYQAKVTWDAPVLATRYVVNYRAKGTRNWIAFRAGTNSAPLKGLNENTEYEVQIFTVCGSETTETASNIQTFRTLVETECKCPRSITIRTRPTNAQLEWTPAKFATAYQVAYRGYKKDECAGLFTYDTVIEPRYYLDGLLPNHVYNVIVRTICGDQLSESCLVRNIETTLRRLDDNEGNSMQAILYPNPNNGSFTLALAESTDLPILLSVYDLSGRLLQQKEYYLETNSIDLNVNFTPISIGAYILTYQVGESRQSIKFYVTE